MIIEFNVWKIIIDLLNSPYQNKVIGIDENEKNVYTFNFMDHSINNSSCDALRLIFSYARWILKNDINDNIKTEWDKNRRSKRFFR